MLMDFVSVQADPNEVSQGGSLAGKSGIAATVRGEPMRQGLAGLPTVIGRRRREEEGLR